MSRFYRETMKGALGESVAQMLNDTPGTAMTVLHEELAIARVAAQQILEPFGMALDTEAPVEVRAGLGVSVMDAMQKVADLANAASRIDVARHALQGSLVQALELIVSRVTRAAYEAFGDDYKVKDFVDALRRDLTLPATLGGDGNVLGQGILRGTRVLPDGSIIDESELAPDVVDAIVLEMDSMIPSHE